MRSRNAPFDVLSRFLADESGAAATEYALVASGIALAILVSLIALSSQLGGVFSTASTAPN